MKQILAGFAAGALLAGILLRFLPRERSGEPKEETAGLPASSATDASAVPDVDAESIALREATSRLERLRAEVASLKAAGSLEAAVAGKGTAEARSGLVRLFHQNLEDYVRNRDLKIPANEEMSLQLQSLIRRLAEELGLSLDEVGASPQGFAALAREVLDGLEPKLDDAARAEVEEMIAAAGREWEAYAAERGGMTRLERGGKTTEIFDRLTEGLQDRLRGQANDAIGALETLWIQSQPIWTGGHSTHYVSSPEEAAVQWTESWSRDLKLTPVQKSALKPIVDDYVRALAVLHGDEGSDREKASFQLMVRAQHRMLDTLGLSPEQVQELQAQAYVYDFQVRPPK